MNYSKFFSFIEVLGITFLKALSIFLAVSFKPSGLFVLMLGFLDMIMVCHFVNKMVGINSARREMVLKYSKLFWFATVLGIILLTMFFFGVFGIGSWLNTVSMSLSRTQIGVVFVLFCLFSGTGFLSIGIGGIGERYFRNGQGAFSSIVAIIIPSCIFVLIYLITSRLTIAL